MKAWRITLDCGTVLRLSGTPSPGSENAAAMDDGECDDETPWIAPHLPEPETDDDFAVEVLHDAGCCLGDECFEVRCEPCAVPVRFQMDPKPPTPALPEAGSVWRHSCGHETRVLYSNEFETAFEVYCACRHASPYSTDLPFMAKCGWTPITPALPAVGSVWRHVEGDEGQVTHVGGGCVMIGGARYALKDDFYKWWTPVERPAEAVREKAPPLHRCGKPNCPGREYRASERAHPVDCGDPPSPPPPEPEEPDRWHGWSLGDLRMERDRRVRTREAALAEHVQTGKTFEAARLTVCEMDRAIERRKAKP